VFRKAKDRRSTSHLQFHPCPGQSTARSSSSAAMRPVNLIWRRIIESEKPILSLVFGGLGGCITAINQIVQQL
jgi:hypothetical protein